MTLAPVESSAFYAAAYDPNQLVLELQFRTKDGEAGKIWRFAPVPQSTWRQMTAPGASMGRVFSALVKSDPSIVGVTIATCPDCQRASAEYAQHEVCPTCEAVMADAS